jgi:DNA-binding transcriptional MerR regulator
VKPYKIITVSETLNLTPRTIRYYEDEGLLGKVQRSIGGTRYYNDEDIQRLKEIIHLKENGHRISKIKEIFRKKYPPRGSEFYHSVSVESAYILEKDIIRCRELGITILENKLRIGGVLMDYMIWTSLEMDMFLQPFEIITSQKMPKLSSKSPWQGNGLRCIINAAMCQQLDIPLNASNVTDMMAQVTEWAVFPVNITAPNSVQALLNSYYVIEQRKGPNIQRKLLMMDDVCAQLSKQFKQLLWGDQPPIKHVTIHRHSSSVHAQPVVDCMLDLVMNKQRLSIEDVSPVYIYALQTLDAVFISALQ